MKKQLLFLIFISCWLHSFSQGKYVDKVIEFLPAPGQFTNEGGYPAYSKGADAALMAARATAIIRKNAGNTSNNMSTVSLGAYGGYIIVGFDHSIYNRPYAYDFKIHGNMFDGNSEPGIVMVSKDVNGNGIPDDPWYELAGSEYYSPETTHNYEIKYYRPDPLNDHIKWTDNLGREGKVLRNTYHMQESYYPLWYAEDTLVFRGTLLSLNAWNTVPAPNQYWRSEAFAWGYADNQQNSGELSNFSIDWAVDINGNPVELDRIDFIKVYTAVIQDVGWLGETSTEFSQAEDLHTDYSFPPVFKNTIHTVTDLPEAAHQTIISDGFANFNAQWDNDILKNGFTVNSEDGIMSAGLKAAGKEDGQPYLIGVTNNEIKAVVTFSDGLEHGLCGMYVNNTSETISFLKQQKLEKNDYIKLVAKGLNKEGNYTGKEVTFNLADYSFLNSVMNYSVEKWVWMELEALGSVAGIEFSLTASRPEICPNTFCMRELTVSIIPIISHPIAKTVCEGEQYSLTATFGKENLTYQWYKNEEILPGENTNTLDFPAAGLPDIADYYCIAKDESNNQAQTNKAYIDVFETLSLKIKDYADTLYVHIGDTINLKTDMKGNATLYRWHRATSMLNTTQNPTAYSPDLTITDFSLADENKYYLRASGACATSGGYSYSDTMYVKVIIDPEIKTLEITKQPTDAQILYGENAIFEIETSVPALYTWQYLKSNGSWAAINGTFANQSINKPRLNMTTTSQEAFWADIRCMVQNENKSITIYSDTVKVIHKQRLRFIQPDTLLYGDTHKEFTDKIIIMEVEAPDFEPSAYQWYFRPAGTPDYTLLTGENNAVYRLGTYMTTYDAGQYRCDVTGPDGVSSIYYSLTAEEPIPSASKIQKYTVKANGTTLDKVETRADGIFEVGENVNIQLRANTSLSFKWLKDGAEIKNISINANHNTIEPGGYYTMGTATSLFIKEISAEQTGTYQLVVTDGIQEWKSDLFTIMINPEAPEIINDLVSLTVNEDDTFDLIANVDRKNLGITYQWYYNGNPVQCGTKSTHVTTGPDKKQYSLIAKPSNTGYYYYTATTAGGTVTSNVISVTVNPKAVITSHPEDVIVLQGNTAVFSVSAAGENLTFQWLKDGIELEEETNDRLVIENASLHDEGAYTCKVSEPGKLTATSGTAYLNAIERPVISGHVLCNNESSTVLKVQSQYKNTLIRYQWYRNGEVLTGATSTWINVTDVADKTSEYYCLVTNSNDKTKSGNVSVVSNEKPEITENLSAQHVVTIGDPVSLSIAATGTSLQYQWYKDGTKLEGEVDTGLSFTAELTHAGDYQCVVSNSCAEKTSATLHLSVNPVRVESIALNENILSLEKGETFQLEAIVLPENATNKNVQWRSNNEEVATVDEDGLVTAKGKGDVMITAETEDGNLKDTCEITVKETIKVISITLNESKLTLDEGETFQLEATVLPENATNKNVQWRSNNEEVATVDEDGLVTTISFGSVTITVTTVDGNLPDSCMIEVNSKTVGVDNPENILSVYPTITNGIIYIQSSCSEDISIIDITGKILMNKKLTAGKQTLDLSGFSDGIYFIRTENNIIKVILNANR
jgi:uncharacterized protein YjdB